MPTPPSTTISSGSETHEPESKPAPSTVSLSWDDLREMERAGVKLNLQNSPRIVMRIGGETYDLRAGMEEARAREAAYEPHMAEGARKASGSSS